MQALATCLWFDGKAEEAARFYASVFPRSHIDEVLRYSVDTPGGKVGEVMLVEFTLAGRPFMALNAGPSVTFTPAISFTVPCDSQAELDTIWQALLAGGGQPVQCGWLTDRYGVSWQVFPARLISMMRDKDAAKARRVTEAMMGMVKLDLAALEAAYVG